MLHDCNLPGCKKKAQNKAVRSLISGNKHQQTHFCSRCFLEARAIGIQYDVGAHLPSDDAKKRIAKAIGEEVPGALSVYSVLQRIFFQKRLEPSRELETVGWHLVCTTMSLIYTTSSRSYLCVQCSFGTNIFTKLLPKGSCQLGLPHDFDHCWRDKASRSPCLH